jgi:hypothetical protein
MKIDTGKINIYFPKLLVLPQDQRNVVGKIEGRGVGDRSEAEKIPKVFLSTWSLD